MQSHHNNYHRDRNKCANLLFCLLLHCLNRRNPQCNRCLGLSDRMSECVCVCVYFFLHPSLCVCCAGALSYGSSSDVRTMVHAQSQPATTRTTTITRSFGTANTMFSQRHASLANLRDVAICFPQFFLYASNQPVKSQHFATM